MEIFNSSCLQALKVIPQKIAYITETDKNWMTPKLKILINEKHQAFRNKDLEKFKHMKTKIKTEIINAKCEWTSTQSTDAGKF